MRILAIVVVPIALMFLGFVASGLVARFVLIDDNTGFEGGATVVLAGTVGAAIGLVLAILLLKR